MNQLAKAIQEVMDSVRGTGRSFTAGEMLEEIQRREPKSFPLCTWLDVYDEMRKLYGDPRRG